MAILLLLALAAFAGCNSKDDKTVVPRHLCRPVPK
jgi:hypothetical protein